MRADIAGTVVFAATAAFAAISFSTTAQWVGAVTALALFAVGVFCFLVAYVRALGRSRTEEVSVSGLYLLLGPATPRNVKATMWLAVLVQVSIALGTTLARPNGPDGDAGSSLAVGFLVPMFGLAMNGLWSSYHATFAPRTTDAGPIGQNADHG